MKALKTRFVTVAAVVALCAGSSLALAGLVRTDPVTITLSGGTYTAVGSLNSARYSSDTTQDMGCLTDSSGLAECWAQDATGRYVACTSTSSAFVHAAASVGSASNLNFQFPSTSGTCKYLAVSNDSGNLH